MIRQDLESYYLTIGRNVLAARKEQGLSQHDLASLCNIDRAKISKIENGRADFMFSTLLDLAAALNVTVAQLMT